MIGGLLLHDDTTAHERWNCSDSDLLAYGKRYHEALERQNSAIHDSGINDVPIHEGCERRPFYVSDSNLRTPAQALGGSAPGEYAGPTPRDPPHTPAPPDIARTRRGSAKEALFCLLCPTTTRH